MKCNAGTIVCNFNLAGDESHEVKHGRKGLWCTIYYNASTSCLTLLGGGGGGGGNVPL